MAILDTTDLEWGGLSTATIDGVWYIQSAGNTFLFADDSGDGVADLTIQLNGLHTRHVTDLLGVYDDQMPVAADDSLVVAEDSGTTLGNVATNDTPSGNGGNAWTLAMPPINGTAIVNADGSYSYTPNDDFNGADSFTYSIADADGDVSTATVSIAVSAVNDLPVEDADTLQATEDTPVGSPVWL